MEQLKPHENFSLESIEGEIWKPIVGYDGYEISNFGRVKSFKNKNIIHKILSCTKNIYGYIVIRLNNKEKRYTLKVHRLVAMAFIPNPENKRTVNHKNGIKNDNRVENLEWNTDSEQQIHAYKIGLNYTSNLQIERVIKMNKGKTRGSNHNAKKVIDKSNGKIYESLGDACEYFNINKPNLVAMLKGRRRNLTNLTYYTP